MSKEIDLGKKIKQKRLELGLTQSDLGKRLNLNKSTIQRYESGEISRIKLPVLQALASILQTTPAQLMGWDREPDEFDWLTYQKFQGFVPDKIFISDIIAARQKEEQLRNYLSSVYSDQDMIEDAYEINATMQLYNKDGMKKLRERAEEISELPKYTNNDDDTKNPPT